MAQKNIAGELRAAILERELTDAVRRLSFEDIEKIPEMRALISSIMEERQERAILSESLGTLPHQDVQRLFDDYMAERFDVHMHNFFGRMYDGLIKILRTSISARLEVLEESLMDMKRSVLMAAVHPYAWVETEIVREIREFLVTQPAGRAPLQTIYRHVALDVGLPLPGALLTDKYQYLLRVMRQAECFRESEGFLFECGDHAVIDDAEASISADSHRAVSMLRKIAADKRRKDNKESDQ